MPNGQDLAQSRARRRNRARNPLQVADDHRFQLSEWRAQRVGLGALAVLVVAAATGFFGSAGVIFRVVSIYAFLLLVFRIAGKRTVAQMTSFDLVVLLVIGDATQQGLVGQDYSVSTALVAVSCLILADVALARMKSRWPAMDRVVDGVPLVLVVRGRMIRDRMDREGVDAEDILEAARDQHGLRRLEDVDYAVLERHGGISIIPRPDAGPES
jgi:uncharacterized membrane protein YcaP (DUF421 family)